MVAAHCSRRLFLAAATATAAAGCGFKPTHPGPPAMAKAPKFELPSHMGPSYAMRGLITKAPGVVVFYRGASSPYCRTQLAELANHHDAFVEEGVLVVAISIDTPDDARSMAGRLQIPFPLLRDADGATARAYGVTETGDERPIPAVFVIDRKGRVAWRFISRSSGDRPRPAAILEAARAARG